MRAIILIGLLFLAQSLFGQVPNKGAFYGRLYSVMNPVGSSGPIGFLSAGTNSGTSGTSIYVTNSTSSGSSPVMALLHISWYNDTTATISSVTNDAGVSGTLVTNAYWDSNLGQDRLYQWTSATAYAHVQLAAAPSEWILQLGKWTNCSSLVNCMTNYRAAAGGAVPLTNIISSASSQMVASFSTIALNSSATPTFDASAQTLRSYMQISSDHSSAFATAAGASSVTNSILWSENNDPWTLITVTLSP